MTHTAMLTSSFASSFQSCRSPSSDALDMSPPPQPVAVHARPAPLAFRDDNSQPSSSSPHAPRTLSVELREESGASPTCSPPAVVPAATSTAATLLRMRSQRSRSSYSLRASLSAREALSEASPSRVSVECESAEVVARRQRVDRAMMSDRESEGRHTLQREEQEMFMRFLVPFYQLLRECTHKSVKRKEVRQQRRRLPEVAIGTLATPLREPMTLAPSQASHPTAAEPPRRRSESRASIPHRSTEICIAETAAGISPEPVRPPTRRLPFPPSSPSSTPSPTSTAIAVTTASPSGMGRAISLSSPRQMSAERALVAMLNAEEQSTLEAAQRLFVGRVSWLLAEETVARAALSAAEAYAWHHLISQR